MVRSQSLHACIHYKSMGYKKKRMCKLTFDHRPMVLQLDRFNNTSWTKLVSDLGSAPALDQGHSFYTTHFCSVCYKVGHQSNDCTRLSANRNKRRVHYDQTSEQNMLTMAQHTPQIEKGEGLELYMEKEKRPDVSGLNMSEGDDKPDDKTQEEIDAILSDKE